jgi:hypothetical protein
MMKLSADEENRLIARIGVGSSSSAVLSQMSPKFQAQAASIIASLKNEHRSGKFDPVSAQSKIATLCALEDMENQLKAEINAGQSAQKKLNKEIS